MPSNQVAKPSEQQECQNPVNRAQLSRSSLTRNPSAVARIANGPFRVSMTHGLGALLVHVPRVVRRFVLVNHVVVAALSSQKLFKAFVVP